ncbi:transmembrane protein 234 homolog [Tribolium madens]|uniref:transmembrane protein 234 homolog n=1 Tax=Tribolium madens TaxID=41895 RepID=UPI001CF735E6|nr:transmembrane protein 234 homolog [Tribolium madens]
MIFEAVCLICVAILWGGTNPFLKKNSKDITTIKADSAIKQFLLELKYLLTNTRYLIPMALNQLGSILYFLTLQRADLSLAVPVANSLTFVFTAVSGFILGEEPPKKNTILGVLLILVGTFLCCYDNYLVRYKL